jgi:hypothetical protein
VLSFTGPEQLPEDLQSREREFKDILEYQLIAQMHPHLRLTWNFSEVLLLVIRPTMLETASLKGLLYLVIKVSKAVVSPAINQTWLLYGSSVAFSKPVDMHN